MREHQTLQKQVKKCGHINQIASSSRSSKSAYSTAQNAIINAFQKTVSNIQRKCPHVANKNRQNVQTSKNQTGNMIKRPCGHVVNNNTNKQVLRINCPHKNTAQNSNNSEGQKMVPIQFFWDF
nr:PREDICTED: uncharacterized protein LOC103313221 [Tribolium castaneum]|eukprot:XP_008194181.1 PREDICTED: uncharacterized protein LOC103313221 [Tribolium castaneum]